MVNGKPRPPVPRSDGPEHVLSSRAPAARKQNGWYQHRAVSPVLTGPPALITPSTRAFEWRARFRRRENTPFEACLAAPTSKQASGEGTGVLGAGVQTFETLAEKCQHHDLVGSELGVLAFELLRDLAFNHL